MQPLTIKVATIVITIFSQDFSKVMEASLVQLLSSYSPENVRRPVECIGLQVEILKKKYLLKIKTVMKIRFLFQPSLLPDDIMKLEQHHLEYFFHPDQGVLNHLGLPHRDPQVKNLSKMSMVTIVALTHCFFSPSGTSP